MLCLYIHSRFIDVDHAKHKYFYFKLIQHTENICRFSTSVPLALDDIENLLYNGKLQINLRHNFITASVAVVIDSFSFVFVAFTSVNGSSFVTGVS